MRVLKSVGGWLVGKPGDKYRRLGAAFHAKLEQDRRNVILDRFLRQEQPLTDLTIGETFSYQKKNLLFLGRQYGERAKTGVYIVFITNEDGSQTCTTKMLFAN